MARKLEVAIVGDSSSLSRALHSAGAATSGFGSKLGTIAKVGAAALIGLGAGAAAAGRKMVDLASDAAEVDSKLNVVFGRQLPGLTKELDKFAQATGASKFALREQAADMGALIGPILGSKQAASEMSAEFVKLATDLSSFNNVPVDEALLAIRSGLVGESEPLRRFGVLLNEAAINAEGLRLKLIKQGETMTEQEKVQARASLIMKQTAQAQGDATRTAGSMANQMRALQNNVKDAATELGVNLIPYALRLVQSINAHWPQIEAVAGAVFQGIAAAIELIGPPISKALGWLDELFAVIQKAPTWKLKFEVTKDAISDLLFGKTEKIAIPGGQAVIRFREVTTPGLVDQLQVAIAAEMQSIDWGAWAKATLKARFKEFYEGLITFHEVMIAISKKLTPALQAGIVSGIEAIPFQAIGRSALQKLGEALDPRPLAGEIRREATNLGKAILDGLRSGLVGLARAFTEKVQALWAHIQDAAATALTEAAAIGRGIIDGIKAGLGNVKQAIIDALVGPIQAAIDAVKGIFGIESPSRVTQEEIGKPLAEGVIQGFLLGSAELPAKMSEKLRAALTAAKQTIMDARGEMAAAFSELASAGSQALAEMGAEPTKSERLLAKMDLQRQIQEIKDNIKGARAGLKEAWETALAGIAEAEASGDPEKIAAAKAAANEAIKAAEKTLADALLAQKRFDLEQQAQLEREKRDEQTALRQRHFQERLEALQASLEREGASHREAHERIVKLFKSFGIDYRNSGRDLGAALAEGIRDSIKEIEDAAAAAARAAGKYLKLKSPAEKGPLSDLHQWWRPMGGMLAASALAGAGGIGPAVSGGLVPRAAGGIGARPEIIQLVVDGAVLAEVVRRENRRHEKRGGLVT